MLIQDDDSLQCKSQIYNTFLKNKKKKNNDYLCRLQVGNDFLGHKKHLQF